MDEPFPTGFLESVETFLDNDTEPPGQLIYDSVFESEWFWPLQRKRELSQMLALARTYEPRVIMEIGTDKGGSFYHWVQSIPTIQRAIACEIRGIPWKYAFERRFPDRDFLWLEASSYPSGTVAEVQRFLNREFEEQIDILFIDGEKLSFLKDFDAYLPLMNPHGLVLMHDIHEPPVAPAWAEVCRRYETTTIIDRTEGIEAAQRSARDFPITSPYEGWLRYWKGQSCTVGAVFLDKPKGKGRA